MSSEQILGALASRRRRPTGNAIRTELVLPASFAQQIGVMGQQIGDQIVAQWSTITWTNSRKILDAFKQQPGLIKLRGSGDVPYLSQEDAQKWSPIPSREAEALLKAFVEMLKIRDQINDTAKQIKRAGELFLPPEVAASFVQQIDALRDQMLAALTSGLPAEEIKEEMAALEAEMRAFAGLTELYATIEQDIASSPADLTGQLDGMLKSITISLRAADAAVEDARSRAAEAISPQEALAANVAAPRGHPRALSARDEDDPRDSGGHHGDPAGRSPPRRGWRSRPRSFASRTGMWRPSMPCTPAW